MKKQTKTTKLIVTANYKDRSSAFRWLIRGENESLEKTIEFKFVEAVGIKFDRSSEGETGFGCTMVAKCMTATGHNEPQQFDKAGLVRLHFGWNSFSIGDTQTKVWELDSLYLDEEGHMWGKLPAVQKKEPVKEMAEVLN